MQAPTWAMRYFHSMDLFSSYLLIISLILNQLPGVIIWRIVEVFVDAHADFIIHSFDQLWQASHDDFKMKPCCPKHPSPNVLASKRSGCFTTALNICSGKLDIRKTGLGDHLKSFTWSIDHSFQHRNTRSNHSKKGSCLEFMGCRSECEILRATSQLRLRVINTVPREPFVPADHLPRRTSGQIILLNKKLTNWTNRLLDLSNIHIYIICIIHFHKFTFPHPGLRNHALLRVPIALTASSGRVLQCKEGDRNVCRQTPCL